jgi:hypothetical protein
MEIKKPKWNIHQSWKCIERIFSDFENPESPQSSEGQLADVVDAGAGQVEEGESVQVPEDVGLERLDAVAAEVKLDQLRNDRKRLRGDRREAIVVKFEDGEMVKTVESVSVQH